MRQLFLKRRLWYGVSAFLILVSTVLAAYGSETDERISRIQKAYEGIRDVKGNFSQKSIIKDLNRTETFKGDFYIKPPMKMKWIYRGTTAQDLIINNDTVLIYKKAEKQAYRSRFDKATYGQTPVALLGGFGNIRDEFTITLKGDGLMLRPKKPMGNITSIRVSVSDEGFPIRSFTITDSYSNVTEIDLRDVIINTGIKDSIFDPVLPKGVNIFEQSY